MELTIDVANADRDTVAVPGIPEDLDEWSEFEGWTASILLGAIAAIAGANAWDAPELLASVVWKARKDAVSAKSNPIRIEKRLERLRQQLLPGDAVLQRQLYQALHELEALQSRRHGGTAPLARLDIQGLPEG